MYREQVENIFLDKNFPDKKGFFIKVGVKDNYIYFKHSHINCQISISANSNQIYEFFLIYDERLHIFEYYHIESNEQYIEFVHNKLSMYTGNEYNNFIRKLKIDKLIK